jgi:hypothetical protein
VKGRHNDSSLWLRQFSIREGFAARRNQWAFAGSALLRVHKASTQNENLHWKNSNIQWFEGASANPATPTISFTKQFKRLVNFLNFLNFRKNTNKALLAQIWLSEVERWRRSESGGSAGKFK